MVVHNILYATTTTTITIMMQLFKYSLRKSALDPAHVLFVHLSVADLRLHDACVPGRPAEHEQTAGQSVQTVDGPEVPQVVLLRQHEHHRIVPITTARMNLITVTPRNRLSFVMNTFQTHSECAFKYSVSFAFQIRVRILNFKSISIQVQIFYFFVGYILYCSNCFNYIINIIRKQIDI